MAVALAAFGIKILTDPIPFAILALLLTSSNRKD